MGVNHVFPENRWFPGSPVSSEQLTRSSTYLGSDSDALAPGLIRYTFTFPPRWAVTPTPISGGYEALRSQDLMYVGIVGFRRNRDAHGGLRASSHLNRR
ncbi:hypothetical protein N7519_001680 [Penicillium mononematosum]|uniref:uncharacterized protein n=1 Tax=Penicillium mononematosum TaxID=268346 RepID=UPI002549367A|nr:uncharacterized protein N7519_001680 [Penicillium mononematosum]KAJ6191659.1 hypothetical protein N7519_001680 [Penicillium mononematosum]